LVKDKLDAAVDVGQTRKGKVDVDRTFGVEALRDAIEELFEDVRDAGFVEAASFGEAEGVMRVYVAGFLRKNRALFWGSTSNLGWRTKTGARTDAPP